jgi:CDP-6-deoxy-D-xylo-4-hexulose-3-dehydrase
LPSLPDEVFDHKYVYDEIGYNLKPIELQASMGLHQLEKLDEITTLRKRNYNLLFDIYKKYEEYFHLPRATNGSDPSWFAFPLTIKKDAPFKRFDYVNFLEDKKIQTRPYFAGNIMLQPAYSHLMDLETARNEYPNATFSTTNTLFHGTSPVITPEQIKYIGICVDEFMSKL